MNSLYGLIFDVDGVVADTEAVNAQATIRVFEKLFGLRGVRREDFEAGLGRGAEEYVRAAARVHGLELTAEQVRAATAARQTTFLEILNEHPLDPFPGIIELMNETLDDDRFSVAIATSGTRLKSESVLRSTGVPYQRMAYITGDDVTAKKPDPELFLIAAAAMNVSPDRCVVIEDAPNGVQAARAAGCGCIAVTNSTTAENLSSADLVVSSIETIRPADLIEIVSGRHT